VHFIYRRGVIADMTAGFRRTFIEKTHMVVICDGIFGTRLGRGYFFSQCINVGMKLGSEWNRKLTRMDDGFHASGQKRPLAFITLYIVMSSYSYED